MSAWLNRLLRRLGPLGVVGAGVLVSCGAFWISALQPIEAELAAQRVALERQRARAVYQPASSDDAAEDLRRFYRLFPSSEQLTDEVERLHRLGRRAGLHLAQGDYRLERRSAGLWAYRITLPVRGTYSELRGFLAAVLKNMPTASIEALRFERRKPTETQLEAQVRVTLHVRPSGDKP